jgi:hypothetical protein
MRMEMFQAPAARQIGPIEIECMAPAAGACVRRYLCVLRVFRRPKPNLARALESKFEFCRPTFHFTRVLVCSLYIQPHLSYPYPISGEAIYVYKLYHVVSAHANYGSRFSTTCRSATEYRIPTASGLCGLASYSMLCSCHTGRTEHKRPSPHYLILSTSRTEKNNSSEATFVL